MKKINSGKPEEITIDDLKAAAKSPPASIEIEKAVLGAIMLDNKAIPKAIEVLRAEHFYDPRHGLIFAAMTNMFDANEPIDAVSLYEELRKSDNLEEAGGAAFISVLTQDISSAANVDYHSRIVLEKWILRQLISTSMDIATSAYEAKDDVFDILDEAESKIFKITEQGLNESYKGMDKAVREAIEHIEAIHSQNTASFAVPTGFIELDDMLGGFQRSDLIIIAARPSMGKTAFALSAARNAAVEYGQGVAIFSLEMATIQLVTRLICAEARINAHSVRTGKFKAEEGSRISRTAHKLSQAPIFIDDTPGQTVLQVRAKARRLKAEKNIKLVVIDYLQLMTSPAHAHSREQEISNISRSLKALAKELDVPVIALSQLNRSVEATADKRPMLSHLRESGAIEQDADVVMFLYRPEAYGITADHEGNSTEGIGEVIIAKQRNGPVGDCRLQFIKQYARFENLELIHSELAPPELPDAPEEDYPF